MPDVVPVQQGSDFSNRCQTVFQCARNCALPAAAESSEPQHTATLFQQTLLDICVYCTLLPTDVGGPTDVVDDPRRRDALRRRSYGGGEALLLLGPWGLVLIIAVHAHGKQASVSGVGAAGSHCDCRLGV